MALLARESEKDLHAAGGIFGEDLGGNLLQGNHRSGRTKGKQGEDGNEEEFHQSI